MYIKTSKLFERHSFCFINPPILDYALYDLFSVPLGLLKTIKILKYLKADVFYIDALDKNFDSSFFEKGTIKPVIKGNGTGKYWKKRIEPLKELKFFDREFYRFGLDFDKIIEILKSKNKFEFIITSCVFTYHYVSLKILAQKIKENFPDTKIVLAGIYPKLLKDHASTLGFDYVFDGDPIDFIAFIANLLSINIDITSILKDSDFIYPGKIDEDKSNFKEIVPEWGIVNNTKYGVIRITSGCPYSCPYCASNILSGKFRKLPLDYALNQLKYFSKNKVYNIAFYDDALLIDLNHFFDFIDKAYKIDSSFNFYLPNAIHISRTNREVLNKLKNFKMIRFGLESIRPEDEKYGNKFTIDQLKDLIKNLNESGIPKNYISFYTLAGLPNQTFEEVELTIKTALKLGIKPRIAEYSPIPGTPLFVKAKEELIKNGKTYIDLNEPLFHNPSVYPYIATEFTYEKMQRLRNLIYS